MLSRLSLVLCLLSLSVRCSDQPAPPDTAVIPDVPAREHVSQDHRARETVVPDAPAALDLMELEVEVPAEVLEEVAAPVDTDLDGLFDHTEADLGTDPLVPDTDTDGILDGQEVAEGTDPLDPSSASAWHPEWNEYPRLLFGPDAVAGLRLRALEPPAAHGVMLARVRARAGEEAEPPRTVSYDPYHEMKRAAIAHAKAFVALLDDDAVAAVAAAQVAEGINPNLHEIGFTSPFYSKTDIHAAEAIIYYCQAYDFLRGSGLLSAGELSAMEESIVGLVTALETEVTVGPMMALLTMAQNNHNMKTYAGIGIAGVVFNNRPEAARWVNRGVTELAYYFGDYQSTDDGGYAEGPSYLNYGLGDTLSFLWAYHRFAAGRTFWFRNFFDTRDKQDELFVWHGDPTQDEHLHSVFLWPVRIMMPGGLSPNIDDSHTSPLASGFLAAFFDDPVFLWHWLLPQNNLLSSAGIDAAVAIFALLDPEMVPKAPELDPDQFLYAAGNCVFRSSYEAEADTYVLLLGEHGKIRKHGQGHEHPDASQLLLHARGEFLLIDSGYVNWEGKDAVSHPNNHNLILVDGVGPPDNELTGIGSDAFLEGFAPEPGFKSCTSRTSYEAVEFERTALLVDEDLLVVADRIDAAKVHDYSLLWHGNGGGTTNGDFSLGSHGAAWSRAKARLDCVCAGAEVDIAVEAQEFPHSFSYGQLESHESLVCGFTGGVASVLSVFRIADPAAEAVAAPEVLSAGQGLALVKVTGAQGYVVVAAQGEDFLGEAFDAPCSTVQSDARLIVLWCDSNNELVEAKAVGGSFLEAW